MHSLLVWHWNWNVPHNDFTEEAVLVLVTSANLMPSGGMVDVVDGIISGDLRETSRHLSQVSHVPHADDDLRVICIDWTFQID